MCCEPDVQHDMLAFHCNFATKDGECCNQPLKEGWITACSHLFCYEHAKEWFHNHDDCPVCRSGQVKVVRMDLSQTSAKRRGRMSLIGMTPYEVLESTDTALSFWVDQKIFEFQRRGQRQSKLQSRQQSIEELVKAKLGEAEATCNSLEAEQRALQQQIDEKDKENRKLAEQVQRVKWDLASAEDLLGNLQKQVTGEHRQDLFRRPLMEAPLPSQVLPGTGGAVTRGTHMGHFSRPSAPAPVTGAALGSVACHDQAERSAAPQTGAFNEFRGASSTRKLPNFTPGFLGTGRVTKRRIA